MHCRACGGALPARICATARAPRALAIRRVSSPQSSCTMRPLARASSRCAGPKSLHAILFAMQHGQLVWDKAAHNGRPSKAFEHGHERRLLARRRHTIWWKRCSRRMLLRGQWAQHSMGRPPSAEGLRSLSLRGPLPGPSRAPATGSASLLPLHFSHQQHFPAK